MNTIYQISDCHLSDESSYENLRRALEYVSKDTACKTIFLTGDICCNPKSGDYIRLEAFIRQHISAQSIYAVAGNHDDSRLMRKELKGSTIFVTDKATSCGREFVFLDSSFKPLDKRHPLASGRIDNRGMAQLKQQLRKANDPIVVVHHPVIPVGADWMKAIRLENEADVMNVLRKYRVRDVICGHGHDGITATQQGVTQYMAPSTAYGFDHSINEYNRSEKIGLSRISLSNDSIEYQTVYF
ncbi:3',5'-cyclic-AMP phosphodiesterase [Vibrio crassostreae]|uniref:metallophosphoesterase family protein n=1 Tax=Vibrio crassostreae TaxID=246167 RepID=UPI00104719F2|nr:metallophosphoesterase [Vibrio crassostreae]TCT75802.1 Icc protein [Vibrio crassostreae]CAK1852720.1 3',5'-cyclic-AMP phosphodiesterase [Vibrio crassostreae]CAK2129988.1 3',5'-cyclic-AMP phosphodiesterase [Vibrio crassostreae]CAK2140840.1 3',5'-cyclic-AMP phosphodiesterase [Vibrio crassostreae]CAK2151179.1 3',5'-cyclic-AMP phosphodiesterase [Vibrio crassostreae]